MIDPYRRKAKRLRVIITTLAYAHPLMPMEEAGPIILESEKRAAMLEAPELPKEYVHPKLKDTTPETGAAFMNLCPHIVEYVRDGKTIHAIKEFRAATGWGLKESKYAVEYWRDEYM